MVHGVAWSGQNSFGLFVFTTSPLGERSAEGRVRGADHGRTWFRSAKPRWCSARSLGFGPAAWLQVSIVGWSKRSLGSGGPPRATAGAVGLAATSRDSNHPTARFHDRVSPTQDACNGQFSCYNGALHLVTHESFDGSSSASQVPIQEREVLASLQPESQ